MKKSSIDCLEGRRKNDRLQSGGLEGIVGSDTAISTAGKNGPWLNGERD
jgi:hypothetical protein